MEKEDQIFSVELVSKQVEIITGQGVGIYGGGGFRLLTPAQRGFVNDLSALGLDEFVFDPVL